jgi:hypothetical protein
MNDWSPPVAPVAPAAPRGSTSTASATRYISDAEWEYRLRALNRQDRFERAEDAHSKRLWCLMLTLMILCGAAVLVAVVVAAALFMSQN